MIKKTLVKHFALMGLFVACSAGAFAQTPSLEEGQPLAVTKTEGDNDLLNDQFITVLGQEYPGARIEIKSFTLINGSQQPGKEIRRVLVSADDAKGSANLRVESIGEESGNRTTEYRVRFSAWFRAPVAVERIAPKTPLKAEMFRWNDVDLSSGPDRRFRGLILDSDTSFKDLETRQTILEGSFPLIHMVQKIPDVRMGDSVRLRIISGGLTLVTQGVVQESGYRGKSVTVLTKQTKKKLIGKVKDSDTVEVIL